jgi:hypothetical protein
MQLHFLRPTYVKIPLILLLSAAFKGSVAQQKPKRDTNIVISIQSPSIDTQFRVRKNMDSFSIENLKNDKFNIDVQVPKLPVIEIKNIIQDSLFGKLSIRVKSQSKPNDVLIPEIIRDTPSVPQTVSGNTNSTLIKKHPLRLVGTFFLLGLILGSLFSIVPRMRKLIRKKQKSSMETKIREKAVQKTSEGTNAEELSKKGSNGQDTTEEIKKTTADLKKQIAEKEKEYKDALENAKQKMEKDHAAELKKQQAEKEKEFKDELKNAKQKLEKDHAAELKKQQAEKDNERKTALEAAQHEKEKALAIQKTELEDIYKNEIQSLNATGKKILDNFYGPLLDDLKGAGKDDGVKMQALVKRLLQITFMSKSHFSIRANDFRDDDTLNMKLLNGEFPAPFKKQTVNSAPFESDPLTGAVILLMQKHQIKSLDEVFINGNQIVS